MKVLFLIEGWISPAPRYRVLQFLPYLIEEGVDFQVRALHGHSYPFFYHYPVVGSLYKAVVRGLRRWYHLRDAGDYDVVFQQRLSLPFTSWLERRLAKKNPRLIFDFDDAIFQTELGPDPRRAKVFKEVVDSARAVVAGSAWLAGHARPDAVVIPTVIHTDQYLPGLGHEAGSPLVIGWMGTHSNFVNFEQNGVLAALETVLARFPEVEFHVVADREPEFRLPRMRFFPWSKDNEIQRLQSFHIGIMPLADTVWNRGKCAFKLIQYMSVGLPVVAGAVGANKEVVRDGETGFLVEDGAGWTEALSRLVTDAALRKRFGALGRERCVASYSLESCKHTFLAVLRDVAEGRG